MRSRERARSRLTVPALLRPGAYEDLTRRLTKIEKQLSGVRKRLDTGTAIVDIPVPAFHELVTEVVSLKRTMLREDRLWILWQAAANVAKLNGAAAEIGTYRGGSAYFIAAAFRAAGADVEMDVIDTFAGHPSDKLSEHDAEDHKHDDKFKNTSYEDVAAYLSAFPAVTVHQGEFSAVAAELPARDYSFVHVDVDIYEPAAACLEFFAPRLLPGGVIVLDDYNAPKCPGIARAASEFLTAHPGFQSWNPHTEQLLLVKGA